MITKASKKILQELPPVAGATSAQLEGAVLPEIDSVLEMAIESLESDNNFVRFLLDSIPSPIFITQRDTSIKYANPALENLTGYGRAELIGRKLPYPWWPPALSENYQRAAAASRRMDLNQVERSFVGKNGEPFWVSVKVKSLKDGRYYLGVWEDLTERKLAEKKFLESEASYSNLFQSMAQGVIYLDRLGRVLKANASACNILEATPEQLMGRVIAEQPWTLMDENNVELTREAVPALKALATGQPVKNVIVKTRRQDGQSERWLNMDAIPEFLPGESQAFRVFVTIRDVTGRRKAEDQFKQAVMEWQNTFDSISDLVSIQDKDFRLIKVNRAYANLLNKKPEELVGQRCFSLLHGSHCPVPACPHRQTLQSGKASTSSYYEPCFGLHLEVTTSPIFDSQGALLGSVHIARDISQRKAIQERLSRVQQFNSQILANAPNPMMVISGDNSIQYVNPAFEKLTGFREGEVLGIKPPFPYWPVENAEEYALDYSNQEITRCEKRFRKKSGEIFWVRLASAPVEENGAVKYHLVNWADITELKQINHTLTESESKFRILAEQSPNLIFINKGGKVIYANRRCEELTGYSRDELCSPSFSYMNLIAPNYRDLINQRFSNHADGLEVEPFEYEVITKAGGYVPVLYSTKLITFDGGPAILGTIVDISERKRAEEKLARREQLYKSLFENMLNGFAYCQIVYEDNQPVDFVYLAVNKAFTLHTGLAGVVGKRVSEVIPGIHQTNPELLTIYSRVAEKGMPEQFEDFIPGLDMWFSVAVYSPEKGYFVSVFDVITERKRAQESLKNSYDKVQAALQSTIDVASKIVEMKDTYTAGHQQRVAKLAMAIAREMQLGEDKVTYLGLAAKVHDIGKIHVPAEILNKTGRLSKLEFQMMMTHTQGGYDILNGVDFPWPLARIVLQHHERIDGSGYPQGLKGEEIMLEARIVAVADTVEAMISHRPYRPSLGIKEAMDEIRSNRNKLYDDRVVEACLHLVENQGFSFEN